MAAEFVRLRLWIGLVPDLELTKFAGRLQFRDLMVLDASAPSLKDFTNQLADFLRLSLTNQFDASIQLISDPTENVKIPGNFEH